MSWEKKDDENDIWRRKKDGPPDLDKIIRNFFSRLFSGEGGNTSFSEKGNKHGKWNNPGWLAIAGILVLMYGATGFYLVQPAESAVVTRFGKFYSVNEPGLYWLPRFIDKKVVVNVEEVNTLKRKSTMLTTDENLANVEIAIQYRIFDPKSYLFNVRGPVDSLEQIVDSALRDVVGHTTLDSILTDGRSQVVSQVRALVEEIVDKYKIGIIVLDVALQMVKPPKEVEDAFHDAIKAQSDEDALKNKADAYARKIVPEAKGQAEKIIRAAQAKKRERILLAEGEASKFALLVPEYEAAPNLIKKRMYLEVMEKILANTNKVLLDTDQNGGNIIYLPLDKLVEDRAVLQGGNSKLENVVKMNKLDTTLVGGIGNE